MRNIKIIILLCVFIASVSFAEVNPNDLSESQSNLIKAKDSIAVLIKIAGEFSRTNQDSSLKYYLHSLDISRRVDDYKSQSDILSHMLGIYKNLGKLEEINIYEKEMTNVYKFLLGKSQEKSSMYILLQLASTYMDVNTDSATYYNNRVIQLSEKYDDDKSKAEAYLNIGYIYSHLTENLKALEYFQNAYKIFKKNNYLSGTAGTLQAISKINIFFGNYDVALKNEEDAAQIYKKIKDNYGYYRALRHIGEIYYQTGDSVRSFQIFKTAIDNAKRNKDYDVVSSIYQSLGSIYWKRKDFNEALRYFFKALYLRTYYKEPAFRAVNTYGALGNVYRSMKEHKISLQYFLKAYSLSKQIDNLNTLAKTEKNLAMTYTNLGDYKTSISYFNQSISHAQKVGNNSLILEDYYEIQKNYEKENDYRTALTFYEKYAALKDSLDVFENQNKILQYRSIYEMEKQAREIQLLKNDEQRVMLTSAIIISALVLVVLLFLLSRYKIKTNSNKKLLEKNKEIAGALSSVEKINADLKSSEATYRYLFERNPMPMLIWDIGTFKILAVNMAAVAHYGYSTEEFLQMKIQDLRQHPETFKFDRPYSSFTSKIDRMENVKHKRKDGTLIDVEVIAHPLVFEGKNVRHIMIQDVTERKLIEQAVIESEERYRNLFDGAPDAVILIDHNMEIIKDANPAATKLLNKSWAELIGTPYLRLFPPARYEDIRHFFFLISGNYNSSMIESEILQPDETKLPVEISGILVRSHSYSVYQIIIRDISFKKKSERKLRESEQRLIKTQKIAHVGNWEYDLHTKEFWMSEEAYNIYGIDPAIEHVTLQSILDCVVSEDKQAVTSLNSGLQTEHAELEFVYRTKKQNTGEIRTIQAKAEFVKNENNETVKMLGAIRDITDIKMYQDELIKAKDEAELSDRLKSDFLAQMSHEIRSPVNIILSFTSLIKEEVNHNISEDMEMCFNAIDNGGRRLIRTIDLILNVADVQSGKFDVKLEETNLSEDIIKNLLLEFSSAAKSKGLNIDFINNLGRKKLLIDRYTVTQIFANLIDNAIKYTKTGGIQIILNGNADVITVEIKDTGMGIAEDYIPHLFDPFTQEEHGYSRRFEGTGLGLSLVKKYCDINNAVINVESEKGKGTTFRVEFSGLN